MALEAWSRTASGSLRRPLAGGELTVHALSSKIGLAHVIAACTVTGLGDRSTDDLTMSLRAGALAIRFRWPNIASAIVDDPPYFEYETPSTYEAMTWAHKVVRLIDEADVADALRSLNFRVVEDSSFAVWLDAHSDECTRILCARESL